MGRRSLIVGGVLLALGLACGSGPGTPDPTPPVEANISFEAEIGTLAKKIAADPGARAKLLEEQGISEADYEKALFEIAMDPGRTKAFLEAKGG